MKKEQTYDLAGNGLQDNPNKGRIGAIVRLAVMAAMFLLFLALSIRELAEGNLVHALASFVGCFAFPCFGWLYVKACCLATPLVKAVWEWVIPLTVVAFFVKIAVCIALFGLPAMFFVEYVMSPFTDLLGEANTVLSILLLAFMVLLTALFAWIDLCRLRGRSFLRSVRGAVSKKTA